MKMPIHAVLTGDLVQSRRTSAARVDAAIAALSEASSAFSTALNLDLGFTRDRGDGWQVVLSEPRLVLRAMIYLRARLIGADLGLDTRISAGIGFIESRGTRDLSDATGEAFFISGDHLEMTKKRRMVLAGAGIGIWQNAVILLADQLVSGWSAAQAEAAAIMVLHETTQEDIAGRLGITRQAVQLRLAGSGLAALDEAFEAFKTHDYEGHRVHE